MCLTPYTWDLPRSWGNMAHETTTLPIDDFGLAVDDGLSKPHGC